MLKTIASVADLNTACEELRPVIAKVDTESFMVGCVFETGDVIHITGRRENGELVDREVTPAALADYTMLAIDIDEWHDEPTPLAKHNGRSYALTGTSDHCVKLRTF